MQAAEVFMKYDSLCSTHTPNHGAVDEMMKNSQLVLSIAKPFMHYSYNNFFLEPNQILSKMNKIAHIPAIIVHGRWDAICLPDMAYQLHKKWENSILWIPMYGGHSSFDPPIEASLGKAADTFVELLRN